MQGASLHRRHRFWMPDVGYSDFEYSTPARKRCGASLPTALQDAVAFLPLWGDFVVVWNLNALCFEAIDGFDHGLAGVAFEPGGGAPWVIGGFGDQSMFYGILMGVVQPREI